MLERTTRFTHISIVQGECRIQKQLANKKGEREPFTCIHVAKPLSFLAAFRVWFMSHFSVFFVFGLGFIFGAG